MDVYEYAGSLQRKCGELSVCADDLGVEVEADARRAKIAGRVTLNEHVFLNVSEVVEADRGTVRRMKASYYLVEHGIERWGFDLDPSHEPAEHMHYGAGHQRSVARCATLPQAIERAWDSTSKEAESEAARLVEAARIERA
jgi:hypothetical protein